MNCCNIRAFLTVSKQSIITMVNMKETILFPFAIYISDNFDTIQNIRIISSDEKEYQVSMLDGDKVTHIGSTCYCLFANTAKPLSEPLYNFLKPGCRLQIHCDNPSITFKATYDQALLSNEEKQNIMSTNSEKPYVAMYEFRDNSFYSWNPGKTHDPYVLKITYLV